jgi:hypothetical protein
MNHPAIYVIKILLTTLIVLGSAACNISIGQHLLLDRLTIGQSDGKVYISCIVKAGNTCNGIVLYRSLNNVDYEVIDKILGVCGNITSPQAYDFVDKDPVKNAVNYYKLELGGYGFSDVLSIHILDLSKDGLLVRPNPSNGMTTLNFKNESQGESVISLYDSYGRTVFTKSTFDTSVQLDVSTYAPGMYYFEVLQDKKYFNTAGRLVVIR